MSRVLFEQGPLRVVSKLPWECRDADRAAREYDSDLRLGRNEEFDEWVVFNMTGQPRPVLSLGNRLPPAAAIKQRLWEGDTRHRGLQILKDVARRREASLQAARNKAKDGDLAVAEAAEYVLRKDGKHPFPRIFV